MPVDPGTLLVVRSDRFGSDEPDLGHKLMEGYLTNLLESGKLPATIICMTSGVFLTTQGSGVLDLMRKLEEAGTRIFSCGTCLDYYGRRDKLVVGEAGNMKGTVKAFQEFDRIIQI